MITLIKMERTHLPWTLGYKFKQNYARGTDLHVASRYTTFRGRQRSWNNIKQTMHMRVSLCPIHGVPLSIFPPVVAITSSFPSCFIYYHRLQWPCPRSLRSEETPDIQTPTSSINTFLPKLGKLCSSFSPNKHNTILPHITPLSYVIMRSTRMMRKKITAGILYLQEQEVFRN